MIIHLTIIWVEIIKLLIYLLLNRVKFWDYWLVLIYCGLWLRLFYFCLDVLFCLFTDLIDCFYLV